MASSITLPIFEDQTELRDRCLTISGARIGDYSYSISEQEGTLLSSTLIPSMTTAGEIVQDHYAVTANRLEEMLPRAIAARLAGSRKNQEPRVRGGHTPGGIHRPIPPPDFKLDFSLVPASRTAIDVVVKRAQEELFTGRLQPGGRLTTSLSAGSYVLQTMAATGQNSAYPIQLFRDCTFDVASGRLESSS
jgi:hypothetical protein